MSCDLKEIQVNPEIAHNNYPYSWILQVENSKNRTFSAKSKIIKESWISDFTQAKEKIQKSCEVQSGKYTSERPPTKIFRRYRMELSNAKSCFS